MNAGLKGPNLFAVGAPKAGTSSLYRYLGQHPDIFVPPVKETHHFSYPEVTDTFYKVKFYRARDEYLRLYGEARGERWLGDFSPSYLFSAHAAERIHEFCADSRIIIVLREPADRTISHYLMDRRLGLQDRPLLDCVDGSPGNELFFKEYIEMSRYVGQVNRYVEKFGRSRVHIARYDDLVADTHAFVRNVFRFLELDPDLPIDVGESHNPFRAPRVRVVTRLYNSGLRRAGAKLVPRGIKQAIRQLAFSSKKPDMSRERAELARFFSDEIADLERVTGLDLTTWKSADI